MGGGGRFCPGLLLRAHEISCMSRTSLAYRKNEPGSASVLQGKPTILSVMLELQADCFAGVWGQQDARSAAYWKGRGDLEEALNTAAAIGDDRLQRQSMGRVVPQQLHPHGTSEQRYQLVQARLRRGRWPNAIHLMVCNGTGTGFFRAASCPLSPRMPKACKC